MSKDFLPGDGPPGVAGQITQEFLLALRKLDPLSIIETHFAPGQIHAPAGQRDLFDIAGAFRRPA